MLWSCVAHAQRPTLKQTIYFEPYQVSIKDLSRLFSFRDSIKSLSSITIEIEGNADSSGNYSYNKILSIKRTNAVKELLLKWGIPDSIISIKAFGSDNPVTSNKTRSGRDLNRRVDILVWESHLSVTEIPPPRPSINELYKRIALPFQSFCIDPNRDNERDWHLSICWGAAWGTGCDRCNQI